MEEHLSYFNVLISIVNREFRTIIHLNNKSMRIAVFLKTFAIHKFILNSNTLVLVKEAGGCKDTVH